jgi:ribosome maturation factor RimP
MQDPTTTEAAAGLRAAAARSSALADLVERTLRGLGYELVDLERAGRGLLRVTLDVVAPDSAGTGGGTVPPGGSADGPHVGIEDCERVSRHLTHLFAVEGVDYDRLEVSSPGLDRPLRGRRDFERFAGSMAKVQLYSAIDGRRRLRGQLLGLVAPEAGATSGGAERVRMLLLPEAPAPGTKSAKGSRRPRKRVAELETIEFALADVEKARLAPEWEFDRDALGAAAPARTK